MTCCNTNYKEGSKVLFSANLHTQKLITKIKQFLPVYIFFWRNLDLFFNRWLDIITSHNRVVQTNQCRLNISVGTLYTQAWHQSPATMLWLTINVRVTFLSTRVNQPDNDDSRRRKGKNSVAFTASIILQQEFTNANARMLTHSSFSCLCTPHCNSNI